METKDLLTRANINDYLINYVGFDEDQVSAMPDYVKRELVTDNLDQFEEYINGEA